MSGHYRSYDDDGNPIDVYEFHLVPGWGPIAWLRMRRLLKEGWEYAGKMNVGLLAGPRPSVNWRPPATPASHQHPCHPE